MPDDLTRDQYGNVYVAGVFSGYQFDPSRDDAFRDELGNLYLGNERIFGPSGRGYATGYETLTAIDIGDVGAAANTNFSAFKAGEDYDIAQTVAERSGTFGGAGGIDLGMGALWAALGLAALSFFRRR